MSEISKPPTKSWQGPKQVLQKLLKLWKSGSLMKQCLMPESHFPMVVKIRQPTSKQMASEFSHCQNWATAWKDSSHCGFYQLIWSNINHRQLGSNQLPQQMVFQTPKQLTQWLKVQKEYLTLAAAKNELLTELPRLRQWIQDNPLKLIQHQPNLLRLVSIINWYLSHRKPGCYLRQISLPGIDTKFIENHKAILHEWLQILTPGNQVSPNLPANQFSRVYGFKEKPVPIRFRILDDDLYIQGLSDLAIPAQDFSLMDIGAQDIIVCENDISALSLPWMPKTIVIFGRGYGFEAYKDAAWMQAKRIFYWGDIDTHGFAILNSFRRYFPKAKSLLMDETTLLSHQRSWGQEKAPIKADLNRLTEAEQSLYQKLCDDAFAVRLRLEQEHILFDKVLQTLRRL